MSCSVRATEQENVLEQQSVCDEGCLIPGGGRRDAYDHARATGHRVEWSRLASVFVEFAATPSEEPTHD